MIKHVLIKVFWGPKREHFIRRENTVFAQKLFSVQLVRTN